MTEVETAQRDWPDELDAYFHGPYGASVDWTPESLEWWRRWQAFLKLKAGLMFFVAVAVAVEEDVEQREEFPSDAAKAESER